MLGHVPGKNSVPKVELRSSVQTTIDHHGSAHVWHCPGNAVPETVFALLLSIGSSYPPETDPWLCDRTRKYHRGDAIIARSAPDGIAFHRTSSHGVLCDRSLFDSASFSSSPSRGSPIRNPSSRGKPHRRSTLPNSHLSPPVSSQPHHPTSPAAPGSSTTC